MDADRWLRIESLCADAMERPAAERGAFLDRECGSDGALRHEVESLVTQLEQNAEFLERPAVDLSDVTPVTEAAPETIGPYRVLRPLGRGGMGEVYLALREVDDVRQPVAVKVIREGRATAEVVRRFRLERRILARLGHPNIARLIDAGVTPEGRPYFVMEYVEGEPLHAHCRAGRLSVDDRLALFRVICDAVQHAHRNLVVHRDLKPSNILVDAYGIPKLLDFGIGKVLGDTDAFGTAVETGTARPLTPAYAAPEQLRDEPVTTATDVHALGVLLYELLTDRHPFAGGDESVRALEQAVLHAVPPAPSAVAATADVRRRLAGDLDNIVLKALAKEPDRRFASAAALADDIRRHLAGLPVTARPDTFGYRARKFVRRNAAWVATGLVTFAALGATTGVTLVQSRRVRHESERVISERDKAIEVRGFLMEMLSAAGPDQPFGDTVTARQMLDLQAARVDATYRDQPELKAAMLDALADGYDRLGLLAPAESLARGALELRRARLGDAHPDVAASLNLLGWVLHERGRSTEAEPMLRQAAALRRDAGPRYALDLTRSLNDLGTVLTALGRPGEAGSVLREALALRTEAYGPDHRSVGITASNLAAALYYDGQLAEAIRVQETAVVALTRAVGPDHQRSLLALSNLAVFKHVARDWEGAEREYRLLLERQIAARGRDHPLTAHVMSSLASILTAGASGPADPALVEAEQLFREALALREARLGARHPEVGLALTRLANHLVDVGEVTEGARLLERAVAILTGAYGEDHPDVADALYRLANARWRGGDVAGALTLHRRALRAFDATPGAPRIESLWARASFCDHLFSAPGNEREAEEVCARADEDLRAAPPGQRRMLRRAQLRLAQAHLALGDRAAADSLVQIVQAEGAPEPEDAALLDSLAIAVAVAVGKHQAATGDSSARDRP